MKKILIAVLIFSIIAVTGGFLIKNYYQEKYPLNPNEIYYEIFNKKDILNGQETSAQEVIGKLDRRLNKYHKQFSKLAGTKNEEKIKGLFYMNFVHMFGYYGKRKLPEKTDIKHLLFNTDFNNCGSNTIILGMILDKAGFEFRTISINNGGHGYLEVKFSDGWQILDPTTNLWIDKSTEGLIAGKPRTNKEFFLKATDPRDPKNQEHFKYGNVIKLRENMEKIGLGYEVKIDQYDYIDFSQWQY